MGHIEGLPVRKNWVKAIIQTEGVAHSPDIEIPCSGKILAYFEPDSIALTLSHGDFVLLNSRVFRVDSVKNPNAFDYRRYLHYQNIHYQTFARKDDWDLVEKDTSKTLSSAIIRLREKFIGILRQYLPSEQSFSVGSALILGYKDEISQDIRTAYADTGAMHVLAVSGLHVGIIYIIISFLLNRVNWYHPVWKWAKVILPILIIWGFAMLTGMSPSVKRAATMFSLFIIGTGLARQRNAYNTLAASAFIILIYNPYLITNVGFQLSYAAVFGILYFQPRIARLWLIKNDIGHYFWQLTSMSIAAQITTAPLSMYYFHQLPLSFLLSGVVVIPAAFLILSLGLILFLLESIQPGWGAPAGWALYHLIECVNWVIFKIQHLPWSVIKGIWLSGFVVILLYFLILKTAIAIELRNVRWFLSSLVVLTLISFNYSFSKYKAITKRKAVIYHVNRASAVDFFDGDMRISLTDKNIDESDLAFATQNNRWAEGYNRATTFFFEDTCDYVMDTWMYNKGFVQFYDKRFAFIRSPEDTLPTLPIKINYLVIQHNPKLKIESLPRHFDFDLLIFDASNKWWQIEKWTKECGQRSLPFYDISTKGAFVLDLNKQ
ncbi:MAG: ComEC family competence protein [Bacteroidetes bacterium]|nr:MAG: ComEC family competence protein [Bacteroidota bacterium]